MRRGSSSSSELSRLATFGVVGFVAFLVYLGLIAAVVETGGSPIVGAGLGFVGGTIVSFFGNCRFVFKAAPTALAGRRFFITTLIGLGLNIGLAWLLTEIGLNYLEMTVIIFVVVPAFNYLGHRFWTFAESDGRSRSEAEP